MYCLAQFHPEGVALSLQGEWRAAALVQIQAELAAVTLGSVRRVKIRATEAQFDLSGAWVLHDFIVRQRAAGVTTEFDGPEPPALELIDRTGRPDRPAAELDSISQAAWLDPAAAVEGLGRRTVRSWRLIESLLEFLGQVGMAFGRALWRVARWRPTSIARHIYDTGITAIPIVALIAFLIAVILAYMGAQQLRKFGADIFVVDLVTVGV